MIEIIDANEEMLEGLIVFFKQYYNSEDQICDIEYLKWLYLENPAGLAKLVIAYQEGEIVGLTTLVPIDLSCRTENKTYFAVNVLVLEKCTNKMTFFLMLRKLLKFVKNKGSLLVGHPNAAAYPFWKRMKMDFIPVQYPHVVSSLNFTRDRVDRTLISNPSDFENFSFSSDACSVNMTKSFYEWRFFGYNKGKYKVYLLHKNEKALGFYIVKKVKGIFNVVVDYKFHNDDMSMVKYAAIGTIFFIEEQFAVGGILKIPFIKTKLKPFLSEKGDIGKINLTLACSDF